MRCNGFLSILLFLGCIALVHQSCKPKTLSPERYLAWVGQNEELIKSRKVNGITFQVKYLPAEYLAYKEVMTNNGNLGKFDSLKAVYDCGLYFQIVIEADKNDRQYGNLMNYQISSQQELTERIRYLSFRSHEFIKLKYKESLHVPVLTHFEGVDQLQNKILFQVSFILQDYSCDLKAESFEGVSVVFDDPYWMTGISQFYFERESLITIPKLIL